MVHKINFHNYLEAGMKTLGFMYCAVFRYDATITATGRYFTDFLKNVDNIHTQFRLSYPKMKSPSMYVTEVDENGCVLVYRSSRQGFTHYLMGKLYKFLLSYKTHNILLLNWFLKTLVCTQ